MFPRFGIVLSRVPRVRPITYTRVVQCAAGEADRKKTSSRLSQVQQVLHEAQERAKSAGNDPIPKITIGTTFIYIYIMFVDGFFFFFLFTVLFDWTKRGCVYLILEKWG